MWFEMNTKNIVLFIIFVLILTGIIAAYYYYSIAPKFDPKFAPNNEFSVGRGPYEVDAMLKFFYVDWCPHCKDARPIWDEVKAKFNSEKINDQVIVFEEINCDGGDDDVAEADKYNIDGFPTIKLVMPEKGVDGGPSTEKVVEFDAKPNVEVLERFLRETL